ncbi:MAG TPA: 4-(cytidine 5'-diphospho)-2-C-methyl-D-erythritol kinase [Blastocatellia bacterium]|nr:4-(cytidine 5'-diphospho)-2-C-methyl-D-erythritol kinase [Blastocatellia bacterium]
MLESTHVRSYAKINWTLEVLFRREDGFHEIRTVYQTVSLYDRVRITLTPGSIEVACDNRDVPCDETNLAYRAAAVLRDAAGVTAGARIEIEKRIPVGAGLGGGSSNAASALRGLLRLWSIDVSRDDLQRVAAGLGSDVPFFLVGGTAVGTGRGEVVCPVGQIKVENILLANPGVQVSTAGVYASLSRLTGRAPESNIPFNLFAAEGISELPLAARNDLEQAASAAHPEIAEVKRRLISLGATRALMSGSGATVFGVFDKSETCMRARSELIASGYWAERVRTVDREEFQRTVFDLPPG